MHFKEALATNAPDTAFWEWFLCVLSCSKINSIFFNFLLTLYFFSLLSKMIVSKKIKTMIINKLKFKIWWFGKVLPFFFSSPLFIAIIDIFHIISKNILDNSDFFSTNFAELCNKYLGHVQWKKVLYQNFSWWQSSRVLWEIISKLLSMRILWATCIPKN